MWRAAHVAVCAGTRSRRTPPQPRRCCPGHSRFRISTAPGGGCRASALRQSPPTLRSTASAAAGAAGAGVLSSSPVPSTRGARDRCRPRGGGGHGCHRARDGARSDAGGACPTSSAGIQALADVVGIDGGSGVLGGFDDVVRVASVCRSASCDGRRTVPPTRVGSIAAAEKATGLDLPVPTALPAGVGGPASILVQPQVTATIRFGPAAGALAGTVAHRRRRAGGPGRVRRFDIGRWAADARHVRHGKAERSRQRTRRRLSWRPTSCPGRMSPPVSHRRYGCSATSAPSFRCRRRPGRT